MQRILIVDDNDENIYYLQALLRSSGYEVNTARNGAEALNAALADPPELVISDLLMPIMDGFTLLRQWKADQRINRIPFVVYTATYTDPKDEQLALDLGADAFIVKPTEPAPFMARIREVLAEAVRGDMSPANAPVGGETDLLRQYSEVLIHKLESKALELEEANRTLSTREAHLRAIIENSPNCITSIASDGTVLTMNEAGLRMLEADNAGQVVGERSYKAIVPEFRDAFRELTERVCGGESGSIEYEIEGLKGARRWLELHAAPLRDSAENRTVLLGIALDTTDRKRAERTVQTTLHRFYAILSNLYSGVLLVTDEGKVEFVNQAFCNFYCPEDAPDALVGLSAADMIEKIKQVYLRPEESVVRIKRVVKDGKLILGEEISLQTGKVLQRDFVPLTVDGKSYGRLWVHTDITESKQTEERVRRLNRVYSVLSSINETIVRVKDSQAMLEAACRIAVEKGQFRMAWIGMLDPATQALNTVASSGAVDGYLEELRIDLNDPSTTTGPTARAILTGVHALCNDMEHDPNFVPWRDAALARGYRSSGGFPLKADGQVVGVFTLYASAPGFFAGDELSVLDELAMDVSFALEVGQREEERKRAEAHVRQLNRVYSVLGDINETIVRVKDSQAMLEASCRIATEKGKFHMAWIGMVDTATHLLNPVASSGQVDGYLDRVRIDLVAPNTATGPALRCFQSGEHAICNDVEHELDRPWREYALQLGYRSLAAFPLRRDGQVVGVFNLYANEPAFFDEDEIKLLDELAMDIGFALEVNLHDEERRKADEELRWRTALFEAQVDSATDGILVVDGDGKKIVQNQRIVDLFKIPKEIADLPSDISQVEFVKAQVKDSDQFIEKVNYLYAHPEEVSRDEVELLDGTILERYSSPVKDNANHHFGRIWTFRDITERRQLEEQFRQAQKMEAVGQLTGGIAHDFNNLLTVILGCSEFIGEEAKDNPRLSKMAKMILDAAQRGADLTHRMLAFARRQALQPKPVDINRMFANMESFLRRTLSADIYLEVIKSGEDCTALVDLTQLENALLNLCVNARDAMPGGGKLIVETGIVTLDSDYAELNADVTPGQYILIAVSDTGCGIAPENLGRVFDPFFTTKEVGKGTGLGLSMVYGFAKQSQGHVKIYSEPGHGTSVKLYLPRAGQESEPSNQEATLIADLHGSEIILLVEDNAPVREFAKTQLLYLGYRVLEAANGKDALAILREHPEIDLLFTDVVMPGGLNGRELAQEARKLYPALEVLFCSGYAESAVLHLGLLNEHVQLLNKPYSRLQLARRIRGMLTASQSAPEEERRNG